MPFRARGSASVSVGEPVTARRHSLRAGDPGDCYQVGLSAVYDVLNDPEGQPRSQAPHRPLPGPGARPRSETSRCHLDWAGSPQADEQQGAGAPRATRVSRNQRRWRVGVGVRDQRNGRDPGALKTVSAGDDRQVGGGCVHAATIDCGCHRVVPGPIQHLDHVNRAQSLERVKDGAYSQHRPVWSIQIKIDDKAGLQLSTPFVLMRCRLGGWLPKLCPTLRGAAGKAIPILGQ